MGTYKLSREARADLRNIYRYGLQQWGEQQADTYFEALVHRFEQIAEQPYFYPAVEHIRTGYRRSVCGVDTIYYTVEDDLVNIMAIIGRQDFT